MNSKHRFVVGGLFLCHGLVRVGFGFLILSVHAEMNFSAVMIMFALGVPSLFGGFNLLSGNASAHTIMPIAAIVNVLDFPFGTILSVYYYWFWKYQCGAPNPFNSKPTIAAPGLSEQL